MTTNPVNNNDPYTIAWSMHLPAPTTLEYLTGKAGFIVPPVVIGLGAAWYFIESWYWAGAIAAFIFLVIIIFLGFLAGVADGPTIQYEISKNGLKIDEKTFPYTALDRTKVVELLRSIQLPEQQWANSLAEKSDIKLGAGILKFGSEPTRQKAIKALLFFLGEPV